MPWSIAAAPASASRPCGSFTRRHDGETTFSAYDLGAEA